MNHPVDQRGKLDEDVFAYQQTADGRVRLFYRGKHIKTLAGEEANKFLHRISDLEGKDAQLVMAKVTGNFKRGNERRSS